MISFVHVEMPIYTSKWKCKWAIERSLKINTKNIYLGLISILMVVWVELRSLKRYVEVLTPSTLECNFFFGNTAIAECKQSS